MNRKRKKLVNGTAIAIVVLIVAASLFSYAVQPTHIKEYSEGSSYNSFGNLTYSIPLTNNTTPVSAGSDRGLIQFTPGGLLMNLAGNRSANLSNNRIYGSVLSAVNLQVTVQNESIGFPLSGLTFYISDYSLQASNSSLIMPLTTHYIYAVGVSFVNGKASSAPSGISLSSTEPVFNFVHMTGPCKFWLNFTLIPVMEFGPYYATYTPLPVSISWTDYF